MKTSTEARFVPEVCKIDLVDDEQSQEEIDAYVELPSCPICLSDILNQKDKSLVIPCMHVFCLGCLSAWARQKRLCPLCKGPIKGWLYDIISDNEFRERLLPPSPEPATACTVRPAGSSTWQQPPARHGARYSRWGPVGVGSHDQRLHTSSSSSSSSSRSSCRRGPTAGGSRDSGQAVEPRPYYWRLQQHISAGVGRGAPASEVHHGSIPSQDPAIVWRRSIYERNLWACPVGTTVTSSAAPATAGSARDRQGPSSSSVQSGPAVAGNKHLEAWISRELQALLLEKDVTIVHAFVLGLVRSFGLQQDWSGADAAHHNAILNMPSMAADRGSNSSLFPVRGGTTHGAASSGTSSGSSSGSGSDSQQVPGPGHRVHGPVDVLQRFLFEHAGHFWHELRCFAVSHLNIQSYDSLVVYNNRLHSMAGQATAPGATPVSTSGSSAAAAAAAGDDGTVTPPAFRVQRHAAGSTCPRPVVIDLTGSEEVEPRLDQQNQWQVQQQQQQQPTPMAAQVPAPSPADSSLQPHDVVVRRSTSHAQQLQPRASRWDVGAPAALAAQAPARTAAAAAAAAPFMPAAVAADAGTATGSHPTEEDLLPAAPRAPCPTCPCVLQQYAQRQVQQRHVQQQQAQHQQAQQEACLSNHGPSSGICSREIDMAPHQQDCAGSAAASVGNTHHNLHTCTPPHSRLHSHNSGDGSYSRQHHACAQTLTMRSPHQQRQLHGRPPETCSPGHTYQQYSVHGSLPARRMEQVPYRSRCHLQSARHDVRSNTSSQQQPHAPTATHAQNLHSATCMQQCREQGHRCSSCKRSRHEAHAAGHVHRPAAKRHKHGDEGAVLSRHTACADGICSMRPQQPPLPASVFADAETVQPADSSDRWQLELPHELIDAHLYY